MPVMAVYLVIWSAFRFWKFTALLLALVAGVYFLV